MSASGERGKDRADNVPLAVVAVLSAVLALSLGDALIKMTSARFVIWQIFVIRSALAIPVLLALLVGWAGLGALVPKAVGWTALRSVMLVAMWVCYYVSLPNLQLSVAAATYYTLPLFITLFSAVFTSDRIGRLGWVAVGIGFLGVLLVLRPKASGFTVYALLPLISAMLYAGAMILTRTRCRAEHPLALSLALNVAFIVVGASAALAISSFPSGGRSGFLLAAWSPMGGAEWLAMGLMTASILIGSIGAAIAYQNGPPAMIGTFDFAYVGFAVLWGIVFFGERPGAVAILGMSMIVAAGILAMRR